MNRLDTADELQAELDRKRQEYKPFMQNLAPNLASQRASLPLTHFDWRIETTVDQRNFPATLRGEGSWQKVIIPHYGPPLGKAVTYYRTTFSVSPAMLAKGALFVRFKAVDYKASVFVNGSYVNSHEGGFAAFEFDITAQTQVGENVLLVKVENDYPMLGHVGDDGRKMDGDKVYAATGPGYNDPQLGWHHGPPGMGIWQDVVVEARNPVHILESFVRPIANSDTAEVWLEVINAGIEYKGIKIRHSLYGQNFDTTVYQNALYIPRTVYVPGVGDLVKPTDGQTKELLMGRGVNFLRFRVVLPHARRWSPQTPWLYQLQVELTDDQGHLLDTYGQTFGMRSFRMDTLTVPKGKLFLNEQPIRLRGANTMGSFIQRVMQKDWDGLRDDILLAKIANLNYIRMTQFPVQQEVYEYCDRLGLMTQTDLPLFGVLRRNKWAECIRQTEEMERLVRSHPCNVMVTYINERFPNAEGNPHRHLNTYEEYAGFFRAADEAVHLANPDRVIKPGDGDYDPPSPGLPDSHCYNGWYNGHGLGLGELHKGYWLPVKPGWLYACGEFGSEGLESLNTMQKYYPKSWLPTTAAEEIDWTPNRIPMAQTYRFHFMWMNRQQTVKNWIETSQQHQAWVTRLTTEAFRRDNRMVSFAIHLFIDAWPAGWMKSIMDVDRQPKQAFFAYRHALSPRALSLRTDRYQFTSGEAIPAELWIASDENQTQAGYRLQYQWELAGKVLAFGSTLPLMPAQASQFQGYTTLKAPAVRSRTRLTLRAQLIRPDGVTEHETDLMLTVFPLPSPVKKTVWIAGNTQGVGKKLVQQLGMQMVMDAGQADVVLIDSLPVYQRQKASIDALVNEGKTAIFLLPPAGKHTIADGEITVTNTTMGQYYFASPVTTHRLMNSFDPMDFHFWYDDNKKIVTPLLGQMTEAEGWTGLLRTGQTGWTGSSSYAYAAAEKRYGKGVFRINHVQLVGRVGFNPTARLFAQRLFDK